MLLLLLQWACAIEAAGVARPSELQHWPKIASRQLTQKTHASSDSINAVSSPSPAIATANCRLVLRGHYADQPAQTRASVSDSTTADQGITHMELNCSTTPAGLAVPVAVNSTWVSAQAVKAWQVRGTDRDSRFKTLLQPAHASTCHSLQPNVLSMLQHNSFIQQFGAAVFW